MSLATWITSILAVITGGALVRLIFTRRSLSRLEAAKASLVQIEKKRIAEATAERDEALEGLTVHASQIDQASLDELAGLVNEAFKDPEQ